MKNLLAYLFATALAKLQPLPKLLLLACLLLACMTAHAQDKKAIDSLMRVYSIAKHDTTKILALRYIEFGYRESKPDTVFLLADKVQKWSEKIKFDKGLAFALFDKGFVLARQKKYQEALPYYEKALSYFIKIKRATGILSSYYNINDIYIEQKMYAKSIQFSLEMLALSEKWNIIDLSLQSCFNIGRVYEYVGMPKEALEYYNKLLVLSRKTKDKYWQAYTMRCIGYLDSTKIERYTHEALKMSKENKFDDDIIVEIECYLNLAEYYTKKEKYALADEYLEKATIKTVQFKDNFSYSTLIWIYKAELLWKQHDYEKAAEYAQKALKQLTQDNVDRLNLLLFSNRIHKVLQAVYEKQGKYHEAFIHQKLYYAYKDSLGNGELTKQRVQTELKQAFEQEKNKKELETQKRLATQRLYLYLSLLGLLGAILIGFFILRSRRKINQERAKSDKLLLNILPAETANELKEKGSATPKHYDLITVLFTDFKGFTNIAEKMTPTEVIENLNTCFYALDLICDKYGLEKIKTIGDSYMCAGGLPIANTTNPIDVVSAGLEMQEWMAGWIAGKRANGQEVWELRLGIHSGEAVAGVVGKNKFAYDIWGDTVNLASRMESSGEVGKVNISGATYELVKDKFVCTHRGAVKAKNKGEVEMYFVEEAITS